jgi:protein involved in polysaccharide export with SLBB domain
LRLSDLLTPETILPEAYREKVEVVRVNPNFTREIVLVDVQSLWASRTTPDSALDLELRPQDRISVRSEVIGPMIVTLTGEVRRPGKYSVNRGERLSSVIGRAGGFLPTAFLRGAVFTREALRLQERQQLERFIDIQNQSNLSEGAALAAGGVASGTSEASSGVPAMIAQRRELLQTLQRGVVFGRISIQLDKIETEKPGSLKGTEKDLELEDGDELNVPQQPKSVSILGAVRNTTAVLYKDGESVEYYLGRVGGVTREGDVSQIYILKPDGSALASFVKMRQVEAGDAIVVPFSTDPKIPLIVMVKDVATILGNLAIPFGVILSLLK